MADLTLPGNIYQIGVDPVRIDLMTLVEGVDFDGAYARKIGVPGPDFEIPVLSKPDLIRVKRAAGRPHDLTDVEELERLD